MNLWILFAVIAFVFIVGGGAGFWLWSFARPKPLSWKAHVYQLSDGVMPPITNKGDVIANYRLSDLKTFTKDIVQKIDKKSGAVHYMLKRLNKCVPAVTADCVEVWGQGDKVVDVLLYGDTCTLLKKGYDKKIGQKIFLPMPHDRITMIKTEIQERKDKLQDKKDVLASLTPWVVSGISAICLIIVVYFLVDGFITISENLKIAMEKSSGDQVAVASIYRDIFAYQTTGGIEPKNLNISKPPLIPG